MKMVSVKTVVNHKILLEQKVIDEKNSYHIYHIYSVLSVNSFSKASNFNLKFNVLTMNVNYVLIV